MIPPSVSLLVTIPLTSSGKCIHQRRGRIFSDGKGAGPLRLLFFYRPHITPGDQDGADVTRVRITFGWSFGMVGADCLPGVAVFIYFLFQDPCSDIYVSAAVVERIRLDAVSGQLWKVNRIDLGQSDIDRAIGIVVYG